ncbi:MAG: hypothetical protein U9Q96_02425 [Patescibacteria group bacterium]|nr:hypothetical protein [Patescibacteria group bacterium]
MEVVSSIFALVWAVIRTWWWVLVPIVLLKPVLFMWRWWRMDQCSKGIENILLELKMPREVDRPFRAMEQVFAGFWMFYDPADWYEHWWEGKYQVNLTIEIVSIGGNIHFYLRTPRNLRNLVESSIYSQYPEVEISEVEDYTKNVPQDIPNKTWDIWGTDYETLKKDIYPIKTYSKFFEESPVAKEEKRIDPLAALLEGLAKVEPGEQIWVQLRIKPITVGENNYKERAKEEVDKLTNRNGSSKSKQSPIVKEAADVVILGQLPEGAEKEEEKQWMPPEMKLTPGEREIVAGIESKISKTMFECIIRFVILGEKGKWNKGNLKNVLGFFANFNTENLNALKPWPPSITKIHKHERFFLNMFIYDRLLYLRKRKLFRRYIGRMNYFFPKPGKSIIFNIEELASLFHFIGRAAVPAPMIQRVDSKKVEPPSILPTG